MGRKIKLPGLYQRNGIWHISKSIKGYGRIYRSTGTSDYREAEAQLIHLLEQIRREQVFGIRPEHTFREGAARYLTEKRHIADIATVVTYLRQLDPFIGDLPLGQVHDGTLRPFIDWKQGRRVDTAFCRRIAAVNGAERQRRTADPRCVGYYQLIQARAVKNRTINAALSIVRRILNLAARSWRDARGQLWLQAAPKITELPLDDARDPYPLSLEEQEALFRELPEHLHRMALFKVNSGTREEEVCALRWDWEVPLPELGVSVFLIPKGMVKNREERLVVLNDIARDVVESCRGMHPQHVFVYTDAATGRKHRIQRMNNHAWRKARQRAAIWLCQERGQHLPPNMLIPITCRPKPDRAAEVVRREQLDALLRELLPGFADLHVHDLKHTFGRRLRAAGVKAEDRKVLLGHTNRDITAHYSAVEIDQLIQAANTVCRRGTSAPTLTLIKRRASSRTPPAEGFDAGCDKFAAGEIKGGRVGPAK